MVDNEVGFEILHGLILGRTLPIPVGNEGYEGDDIFSAHGSTICWFFIPSNGSEVFDPRAKLNLSSPSRTVLVKDMCIEVEDGVWV